MKLEIGKKVSHQTIYSYIKHDRRNHGTLYKLLAHHGKIQLGKHHQRLLWIGLI